MRTTLMARAGGLHAKQLLRSHRGRRGFSLIEVIVVVGIVALIAAIAAPAAQRAMSSYQLNLGTETVAATLGYARQAAITMNRDVEVRLLTVAMAPNMPTVQRVRGIVLLDVGESAPRMVAIPRYLPEGIVINTNTDFSTLARLTEETPGGTDPDLPGIGKSYKMRKFRFRPDGSTNLPQLITAPGVNKYFMSLHRETTTSATALPSNFATIQIEPATGAVSVHRP